jgi:heat shock protein HslJ
MTGVSGKVLLALIVLAGSCTGNRALKNDPVIMNGNVTGLENQLFGKYWKLVELNGTIIDSSRNGDREAHIIFKASDNQIVGSGGCNRFSGTFEIADHQIRISQLISTKMACDGTDYEIEFLRKLTSSEYFFTTGNFLFLISEGCVTAKFISKSSGSKE